MTAPTIENEILEARHLTTARELDDWDRWLRDEPVGHYRHASWWIESLRRVGIPGRVFAIREAGAIVGGTSILEFGLGRWWAKLHLVLHGPCLSDSSPQAWAAMIDAVRQHARERNAMLVQFVGVPDENCLQQIKSQLPREQMRSGNFWHGYTTPDPYCALNLVDASEEELWDRLNQNTRRKIRKAQRADVRVIPAATTQDFQEVYRTWLMSSGRKGFSVRPFESVGSAMDQAVRKDMGVVLMARVGEETAGGVFIAWAGRQATYVSGGFNPKFADAGASYILQWEIIKLLHTRGITTYDFGNYSADGVGQFKLGFGAQVHNVSNSIAWIRRPVHWKVSSVLIRPQVIRWLRRWARRRTGFAQSPAANAGAMNGAST